MLNLPNVDIFSMMRAFLIGISGKFHLFIVICLLVFCIFVLRSQTCPQCNIRITRLFKVFISFSTDLDEKPDGYDKDKEIALLYSKVTALEKAENDMKE